MTTSLLDTYTPLTDQLARLQEILATFPRKRILVLGDLCLDRYLHIDPELVEPSLETGLDAHQVTEIVNAPGAAGTLINNLQSLGVADPMLVALVGDDGHGDDLKRALKRQGCSTEYLITARDRLTSTYTKPLIKSATESRELERLDVFTRTSISRDIEDQLLAAFEHLLPTADGVLLLDQVKLADTGCLTTYVRQQLTPLLERCTKEPGVPVLFDSRFRFAQQPNAVAKGNLAELSRLDPTITGNNVEQLTTVCQQITRQTNQPVLITLGSSGSFVFDGADGRIVPGVKVTGPIDVTGAGDSFSVGSLLGRCAGLGWSEAAMIGNLVASITITQLATTGVAKPNEVLARYGNWHAEQQS